MAKKRRRKARKGWLLSGLVGFVKWQVGFMVRIFPSLLLLAMVAGLFLGVRKMLYADPNLVVRKIEVSPPSAQPLGRQNYWESKVVGESIFRVDLKGIARDLSKNPQIKEVQVSRRFPSVVKIDIVQRKPVAFIQYAPQGTYGVVSEDGMILDVAEKSNASLVTIEAYDVGQKYPQIGQSFQHRGFSEAVRFISEFSQHPLANRETLSKISLSSSGHVAATLTGGLNVKLGRYPSAKIATMEKMVHVLDGKAREKIDYLDLQFENAIVKRRN